MFDVQDRLAAVLAVVYLVFNDGWRGGRVDLAAEAIQLGRALADLMPGIPPDRPSVRSSAYDGMAGRRTGSTGVRAARADAVRGSQT
jgi:hypothetical protein